MRPLIVTADDFGLAVPVNEAVEIAHRDGILSAASLMVGAAAAADAVARARRLPSLSVGLHVVLVQGRPVLPPDAVPDLVGPDGAFRDGLVSAGVRFFFRPRVRRQLAAEIDAQFAAFRSTGLVLDHVNAHSHMQLHPTIAATIVDVGRRYGMRAMRVPREPSPAVQGEAEAFSARLGRLGLDVWIRLLRVRLHRAGIAANDWVFGIRHSGGMDETTLLRIIAALPGGLSEIYAHPATRHCPEYDRYMAAYRPCDELRALTSTRVREALVERGLRPAGFADAVVNAVACPKPRPGAAG